MNIGILREIGLTDNEIKVYISLLKTGPRSATKISKEAGIHRSKTYDSLERLIFKGLVHHTTKDFKKIFSANPPKEILNLIEEKESKLREEKDNASSIIKDLESLGENKREESSNNVYEGIKGIKVFHNKMLNTLSKGDFIEVLGIPTIANELLEGYFQEFHKLRIKRGISIKLLYLYEARDFLKQRMDLKLTEARYLEQSIETPSVIWIAKDTVGIFTFEPSTICYEIMNKEVSKGFKSYFDYLWKHANKNGLGSAGA